MGARLKVSYRVRGDASSIEARAEAIALEQSVETPLTVIRDPKILSEIVGRVLAISDLGDGWFDVLIELAAATVGGDAGQLVNMLFGNSSLHEDVRVHDVVLPDELLAAFKGPSLGVDGLRLRAKAEGRALTASALKPQGLSAAELAKLAHELALGGLDLVKDDHGLADQAYCPFADRVKACAAAIRAAAAVTGKHTIYAPSLSGSLADMEREIGIARDEGLAAVLIAPVVAGFSNFQALRRENPDFAFIAHPTLSGAAISPAVFAKLFRLIGADASIFPNYGGRFGYSPATCTAISRALLDPVAGLAPSLPTPAGGMTVQRTPEMLDFFGRESMLLIGGAILAAAHGDIARETEAFVQAVVEHRY
ncbi:RuBisCO large subunit C-terminal-like domain-containing protein [Methylocapsa acidiphila]|uniref:RuBisCO large subunit C-terminal-like domain-containing protein n=1 Tax=Methylocapsa acidiphila TaxID=133552 RepID=UPI000411B6AD|nr:RuBisCO large subunit C-terminal-like domain-containing protein [Methylocapsa acidiphila]